MTAISDGVRLALIAIFAASAMLHLIAPSFLRAIYRRAYDSEAMLRITALPHGLTALFLALPHTHLWGCAMAVVPLFGAVVSMLRHQRYALAVLGMLAMLALPVAIAAAPLS